MLQTTFFSFAKKCMTTLVYLTVEFELGNDVCDCKPGFLFIIVILLWDVHHG